MSTRSSACSLSSHNAPLAACFIISSDDDCRAIKAEGYKMKLIIFCHILLCDIPMVIATLQILLFVHQALNHILTYKETSSNNVWRFYTVLEVWCALFIFSSQEEVLRSHSASVTPLTFLFCALLLQNYWWCKSWNSTHVLVLVLRYKKITNPVYNEEFFESPVCFPVGRPVSIFP